MASTSQLDGQAAVVTGASRGIGLAVAGALVREGARVLLCGRDQAALDAAVRRLGPGKAVAVPADVREPDQVQRVFEAAQERLGGVDVLVNNAGIGRFVPVADMDVATWRDTLDTNLGGVFLCCRAAIPYLRRSARGWIVNVSSLASTAGFARGAAYCASKAGLNAFTEALMQELRAEGIRVSLVLPGSVSTAFSGDERAGADWKLSPDDVARAIVDLLRHEARSLPSRVEIRPARPAGR